MGRARGPLEHTVGFEVMGKRAGKRRVFSGGLCDITHQEKALSAHGQAFGSLRTQGSGRIPPTRDGKKPARPDSLEVC